MNNVTKALIAVIVFLAIIMTIQVQRTKDLEEKWKQAEANLKAYDSQLSVEKEKNVAYQLSINQLEYFQDSVLKALDETRKELKIKDKNLKALQAVQSSFKKKDTIRIVQVDTLFKEPDLAIDTLIGDKWYSVELGLRYPSTIAVAPSFTSEKHIVVSTKKETVEPPKKFFIVRWFQRKHTVLSVDVVEKNPYVEGESSKYIEILK
jgi:uncharacterized lipoprotein YehR (DUF1307 family)